MEESGWEDVRIDNGSAAAAGVLRSLAECLFRSEAHPLGWTVWCVGMCVVCMLWQGSVSDSERKGSLVSSGWSDPKLDTQNMLLFRAEMRAGPGKFQTQVAAIRPACKSLLAL